MSNGMNRATHLFVRRDVDSLSTVDYERAVREADRRFVRALALAFQRGDHLTASATDVPMADAA